MMNVNKLYKELRADGVPVYSISRLNTYNDCPYSYYLTYINKDRGDNNCYGIAGGEVHEWLEDIQNNKLAEEELPTLLEGLLMQLELEGISFPAPNIERNWIEDMKHFASTFKKLETPMITEKRVLYKVADKVWLQGYIDVLGVSGDKNFILDWKTSGKFTGDRLRGMGRQLVLYKDAIEQTTPYTIDSLYWYMIKYIEVDFNGRTRVLSRRNWVEKSKKNLEKALSKEDDLVKEVYIQEAIQNNSIAGLPDYARNKFSVRPHIKYYEGDPKTVEEARQYVLDTASRIESEKEWKPCNIKDNEFFCKYLCNHRKSCKYLKAYNS